MGVAGEAVERVRSLLEEVITVGEARSKGPLTLMALFGALPAGPYELAPDAFRAGTLRITEVDGGVVPELEAVNGSPLPVLLIEGDHLQGARQDRIVTTAVLLAPKARTRLPVACVERGRWSHRERLDLGPSADVAYSRLRARALSTASLSLREGGGRLADQAAVWDDVARKHLEVGARSRTGAMGDSYRRRRHHVRDVLRAFSEPLPGQTGVAACVGGRAVAVDLFDRPQALAAAWSRLLSGYTLDALDARPEEPEPAPSEAVRALLAEAARGEATAHPGVGLGTDVVLTTKTLVASALVWEPGVVHAALLRRPPEGPGTGAQGATRV